MPPKKLKLTKNSNDSASEHAENEESDLSPPSTPVSPSPNSTPIRQERFLTHKPSSSAFRRISSTRLPSPIDLPSSPSSSSSSSSSSSADIAMKLSVGRSLLTKDAKEASQTPYPSPLLMGANTPIVESDNLFDSSSLTFKENHPYRTDSDLYDLSQHSSNGTVQLVSSPEETQPQQSPSLKDSDDGVNTPITNYSDDGVPELPTNGMVRLLSHSNPNLLSTLTRSSATHDLSQLLGAQQLKK